MTAHKIRRTVAKASRCGQYDRIAASLPEEDMRLVLWWADRKKIPAAQVIRDAVSAFFMPFKSNPGLDRETVVKTYSARRT